VEKAPLYAKIKVGKSYKYKEMTQRDATYRTDNEDILGNVGKNYQVIQNVDAFSFFDAIVKDEKAAIFQTAGALGKGERIFITAKMPSYIRLKKDGKEDVIEKYLFLTNSHDRSSAIICDFTPIRIVCNNTLNMALGAKTPNRISIKHTNKALDRLAEAHKVMGMVDTVTNQLQGIFEQMVKTKISDQKLLEYIAMVMSPQTEMISESEFENYYSQKTINLAKEEILPYALGNPTQQLATTKGTVFGAYNAITGFYQNQKEWDSQEEKFDSLILDDVGTARKKTVKAFQQALTLLN